MSYKIDLRAWIILALIIVSAILLSEKGSVMAALNDTNISDNSTNINLTATMIVWDSGSSADLYVNSSAYFFARYLDENSSMISGTGSCDIRSDQFNLAMNLNASEYYATYIYTQPGNYTYNVTCYKEPYQKISELSQIEILPLSSPINPPANNTNTTNTTNSTFDYDHDGYSNLTDCNDYNANINPGMQEILYNGIDDDCNSNTTDYLLFLVSTPKQSYSPSELVRIRMDAPNGSDTYITVNMPSNVSYVYIFTNSTYPAYQDYTLTALSGTYEIEAINYFGNYTTQKTTTFTVQSTMNAEINADKTEVYENEQIHFNAVISGAAGNVNMIWKLDDTNERYTQDFNYSYSGARDYNVVLIVTDQGGNQAIATKKITIRRQYFLKVKAIDNSTGEILVNATARLDSESKNMNSTGETEFKVTNTTYNLRVSNDGYYSYHEDIKLNNSLIFTVKLVQNNADIAPKVTLTSPSNNAVISSGEFRFKFADTTTAECTLYISEGDGWWREMNSSGYLKPDTEYAFMQELDDNTTYSWRIDCRDEDDNTGYSPQYKVSIKKAATQVQTEQTPDTTYNVIQNIYDLIPDFETYSPDEKKIVDYLKMQESLKDAKRKLEMANTDLFNLKYQLSPEAIVTARDEIYARIEKIKDETPQSLSVKNKAEFVKYVDDSDVASLFEEYSKLKGVSLNSNELKSLVEQNKLLQKKATIQTNTYLVEITYISGRTEDITLVARETQYSSSSEGLMYAEFIPQEILGSGSKIVFVTAPDKVLKDNSVFETSLSKATQFVYYITGSVSLEAIPKIKPLVLSLNTNKAGSGGITGFALFDTLGFSEQNKNIFTIEIIVVFILLGVYLFYYYSTSGSSFSLPWQSGKKDAEKINFSKDETFSGNSEMQNVDYISNNESKQSGVSISMNASNLSEIDRQKIGYMMAVLKKANDSLKENDLKGTAMKYYELSFLYGLLDTRSKTIMFSDVISLSDNLTLKNINNLVDQALISLASSNYDEALKIYSSIEEDFSKLSESYKEKVYARCCELALHLNK